MIGKAQGNLVLKKGIEEGSDGDEALWAEPLTSSPLINHAKTMSCPSPSIGPAPSSTSAIPSSLSFPSLPSLAAPSLFASLKTAEYNPCHFTVSDVPVVLQITLTNDDWNGNETDYGGWVCSFMVVMLILGGGTSTTSGISGERNKATRTIATPTTTSTPATATTRRTSGGTKAREGPRLQTRALLFQINGATARSTMLPYCGT